MSQTYQRILKPGEDAFDSLEWDPEMPSLPSPANSPEPVTVKPQPIAVTYTTVGSLVNPNAVPQFTAPNRIQREGANRRPLMSILAGGQYESILQARGPPPPLSRSNSMHYAQQLGRSPVQYSGNASAGSACAARSTPSSIEIAKKKEAEKTAYHYTYQPLHEHVENVGNVENGTGSSGPSKKHSSSNPILPTAASASQVYSVGELMEEEAHVRSTSLPGPIQGLEKMQTLQRLAKFSNPLQQLAITRLSEFSVIKTAEESQRGVSNGNLTDALAKEQDELDRGYKFPPPGLPGPSTTLPKHSAGSYSMSQSASANARPGYPQPLTAGPPGQRQYNMSSVTSTSDYRELFPSAEGSQSYQTYGGFANSSPWGQSTSQPAISGYTSAPVQPEFFNAHTGHCNSELYDTIDPIMAAKYYPSGYAADFGVNYLSTSEEAALHMAEGPEHMRSKKARDARREMKTVEMFETGQRRFHSMNADSYVGELEEMKMTETVAKANPFGAIGPPSKKILPPIRPTPMSNDTVQKKAVSELITPVLDSTFGNLASYAVSNLDGSNNRHSRFVEPHPSLVDSQAERNASLYGEDWGAPPKRSKASTWDDDN